MFLRIIDRKHGDYRHFPTNRDPCSQPWHTMQVMDVLRDVWLEKLKESEPKGK